MSRVRSVSSGTCQRGVTQPCAQKMVPSAGSEPTRATRCRVASLAFAAASNAGGAFRKHRRRCSVLNCRTKLTANYNLLGNGRNYDIIHAASISLDGGREFASSQTNLYMPQNSHDFKRMIQGFVSAFVAIIPSSIFVLVCCVRLQYL